MSNSTKLQQALLDLGLEDLIALPEIRAAEEIARVLEHGPAENLAAALIDLLRQRRIQVWSGHWSQDPEPMDPAIAEDLLKVEGHYEFNSPADQRLRVYYVNLENLRTAEDHPSRTHSADR